MLNRDLIIFNNGLNSNNGMGWFIDEEHDLVWTIIKNTLNDFLIVYNLNSQTFNVTLYEKSKSPCDFLLKTEYLSHPTITFMQKDTCDILMTTGLFLDLNEDEIISSLLSVNDNYYGRKSFSIDFPQKVRIIGFCEGVNHKSFNPELDKEYLELYFYDFPNLKGEEKSDSSFIKYFIDLSNLKVENDQLGITNANVLKYKEDYYEVFRFAVPLTELKIFDLDETKGFKFDVMISDNDGEGQDQKLSYFSTSDLAWLNVNNLGTVSFSNIQDERSITCHFDQNTNFKNPDRVFYTLENCIRGLKSCIDDFSGKFSISHSQDSLYVFVKILDDIRIINSDTVFTSHDFAGIKDLNDNRIVFVSNELNTIPYNNDLLRKIDTTLELPEGNYELFYYSDHINSLGSYTSKAFKDIPFYGIIITK